MEKEQYEIMYNIEENNWWYKGMRKIFFSVLNRYLKERTNLKILDAGCGTGININYLRRYGSVIGIDISNEAIKFSKKRGNLVKRANIEKLPFKDDTFNLVTCFEVIYHKQVRNDIKALKEICRVLKKGGIAVISVPAFKILHSEHDLAVHTKRRYNKEELNEKVKKAGLKIKKISYLNTFLFPLVLVYRIMKKPHKNKPRSDLESTPKYLNKLLTKGLSLESILIKYINFPFGVSLICIAEKP